MKPELVRSMLARASALRTHTLQPWAAIPCQGTLNVQRPCGPQPADSLNNMEHPGPVKPGRHTH